LPRKPNYNFAKRNKELARQAKKDAKQLERQRRKDEAEPKVEPDDQADGDAK
jgi:hypothetical protein